MTSSATASQLSSKMQGFRATLPSEEQKALDALLLSFGRMAMQSETRQLTGAGLFEDAAQSQTMADLRSAIPDLNDNAAVLAITPTVTTITVTTTIASHRVIGCS
jgi:hypothetical protein